MGADAVATAKDPDARRLHKAFLRYHDPSNWKLLRTALKRMGRTDLIGDGEHQLIPAYSPDEERKDYRAPRRKNSAGAHKRRKKKVLTQHTGLPPRQQ